MYKFGQFYGAAFGYVFYLSINNIIHNLRSICIVTVTVFETFF